MLKQRARLPYHAQDHEPVIANGDERRASSGAAEAVERVLHKVEVDAAPYELAEDAFAHLVALVAGGCQDDAGGAVACSRPRADMRRTRLFREQRQRRGEGAIAPEDAAILAGGAPSDSNGGGWISVRDALAKLAQQPFVAPSVREQL